MRTENAKTFVDRYAHHGKPERQGGWNFLKNPEPIKPEFGFETTRDNGGQKKLYFPFMSVSDLHLGTRHFRAKLTSHMLENTSAGEFLAVGDIIDHEYMRGKATWNFAPWHREVLRHLIKKGATYFPGNHDEEARGKEIIRDGKKYQHRHWIGKTIYGITIKNEDMTTDPKGRRIRIKHGDEFDDIVFGKHKKFFYRLGDFFHTPVANFDTLVQEIPGLNKFSLAAGAKRFLKMFMNNGLGVEAEIMRRLDADPTCDGMLYGHSHLPGIKKTPRGKILMNDGSCVQNVEALVRDRHGTYACLTWQKLGIRMVEENGSTYLRTWKQLGVEVTSAPTKIEDDYAKQAERLVRVIFRLAPAKDQQREIRERQRVARYNHALPAYSTAIKLPPHPHRAEQRASRERARHAAPERLDKITAGKLDALSLA